MKKTLLVIIVVFLMALSFIIGSRIGVEAYLQSDAKFKAVLASIYLQYIDSGKIDNLKTALSSDLDIDIYLHAQSERNFFIYLFPEMNFGTENKASAESALVRASTYRKNHPSGFPSKEIIESASEEQKKNYQEFSNTINGVVTKYAK